MQSTRRPVRTTAALASVVVLTLAACGGDDDDSAAEDPTTEESVDEPATEEPATQEPAEEPSGDEPADVPISPSALTLSDQGGDGTSVTVDEVDLPAAGFIAVHGDGGGSPGPVIGVSDLLPAGTTSGVTVPLDEPLAATGTVFPMVHIDTNANGVYEFGTVEGVDGPGTTADGTVAVGPVEITVGADAGAGGDAAADATITIADFSFSGVSEVPVGTTVTVTNDDATAHTWTSVDDAFDSGTLGPGDSFEFTFTEAGTYDYVCSIHPSMTGRIVVTG